MKLPFINIFTSQKKSIPDSVKSMFADKFPDAKNTEWEKKKAIYEAIFYLNDIEHIARFSEKGVHWTDGCVALENSEMDAVFKQASVNTTVIIVGSRLPLEDYLN